MAVKNQRGALAALAAAGGLWAWQNRGKIRGWMETQRDQMQSSAHSSGQRSQMPSTTYSGDTQRIGEHYPTTDTGEFTSDTPQPRKYDPSI